MYDYAHGVSDAIERITHSICTLEFEDHRPLYDWFLEQDVDGKFFRRPLPRQIEFARLNLTYTVMSKRRLLELVKEGHVRGWDDPRMPTITGLRRRGYTAESIRAFADKVGVAKRDMVADVGLLEHCVREDLGRQGQAGHGRAAAAEAGDRQHARRRGALAGRGQPPRGPGPGPAPGAVRPGSCTSSRRTSRKCRPRSGSAWRRGPRCG